MEGVVFSNLGPRFVPTGASLRTTSGFVIRGYRKSLSAFKTDLFNAWQFCVDVLVDAIRASTRTILSGKVGSFVHKRFSALCTGAYGVFAALAVVMAFTATKTLYAIIAICGSEFLAALNACYRKHGVVTLHAVVVASTATKTLRVILTFFWGELFAAMNAACGMRGVFAPHAVVVAFTTTKTLYAFFWGELFTALNACYGGYGIMGLHVESPFDLPCHRTFAASRWRLFNYLHYTT
jgi:hypothetical protein